MSNFPRSANILNRIEKLERRLYDAERRLAQDTGWVPLLLVNGWAQVLSTTPAWRVKSGILYVRGTVAKTGANNAEMQQTVATLPPEATPSDGSRFFVSISDGNTGTTLRILSNGVIDFPKDLVANSALGHSLSCTISLVIL